MALNNNIDLSSINKTETNTTKPKAHKLNKPFRKQKGPARDSEGKFTSGSGGLKSHRNFDWKRVIPVVLVVALAGGFLVYRSFASSNSGLWHEHLVPAASTNAAKVVESRAQKRNHTVIQITNGASATNAKAVLRKTVDPGRYEACLGALAQTGQPRGTVTISAQSGSLATANYSATNNQEYARVGNCFTVNHVGGGSAAANTLTATVTNTRSSSALRVSALFLTYKGRATAVMPEPEPTQPSAGITPNTAFFWQLSGSPSLGVMDSATNSKKVIDFDPSLDRDGADAKIAQFKAKGITVICYFSAGTWESGRADASRLQPYRGALLPEWGEYYLNIKESAVRTVMKERIQRAKDKGCDGVEPDNLDAYDNDKTFNLTKANQLDYLKFLADEAHGRGLLIALKNVPALVPEAVGGQKITDLYDFALNEECYQYSECGNYTQFIAKNKAVFIVEYERNPNCNDAASKNYDAYRANYDLNGKKWEPCQGDW